jgi:dTDP-4-amino-4,6-dideoxygalactose transaminase
VEGTVRLVDLQAQVQTLGAELTDAIAAVVERGAFILGSEVEEFEQAFAAYCGVRHAVGLDSGMSAIELALRALEIGPGDEVITQANTFIATPGAIMAVGATPVLVDCDARGGFDPAQFDAATTSRTRALIPVHMFGLIGAIDGLLAVARARGIKVVEDACQAHGAQLAGRRAGTFGDAGAFSFYPAKNLGALGDGGILVTDSDAVAEQARMMRNYGSQAKYEHVTTPLNRRLDTLQAAALLVKLPHLDKWNARREYLADAYRERLADLPGLDLPVEGESGRHVYHLFVVECDNRDGLRMALQEEGIETGIHYPMPLHLQPALRELGYHAGDCPNAERLASRSLSLPMYPELPLESLERVTRAVRHHLAP